jgi:hypothetical protein
MVVYLFTTEQQRYFFIKEIHTFAKKFMSDKFRQIPFYQRINKATNKLGTIFQLLATRTVEKYISRTVIGMYPWQILFLIGKVALELTEKGYCTTKDMHYYGMKLHAGYRRNRQ